jgi:ABC-type transporter Mla subunit MlaD
MQQKEEVDRLIKTCETGKDSVAAFSRSIDDFSAVVEDLPAVARPLVRRDLSANTNMSADEWNAFLERLGARYGAIYDAARRVAEALDEANDGKVAEATAALKDAAAPLVESADVAAEQIQTMEAYLEGLPAKINMIPDAFLKADVREGLIGSVPGYVERARAVKELLNEAKEELSSIVAG